jgi:predicted dehydrogenase
MIRLGIIGCGEHSESGHAISLARFRNSHPNEIELTAACDVKRERAEFFCQQYGFLKPYSDADEMLAQEKVDGCIAVVPVEKIPEVGIKLLRLGLCCTVEKPLGASVHDVQALLDAARTTQTPNMVSVNRRFMPFLNRAIEWTAKSGPLRYVRCTFTRHQRTEPEFLWGTAVHAVDALRHIAGDVAEAGIRTLLPVHGGADWYAIDLRFNNGVAGRVDVLPTTGVLDETYELFGEGYRAIVTAPFGFRRGMRCFQGNELVVEESSEGVPEDVLNGCYDEASAFISALANKKRPRPSIADVFPSVELCLQLARAATQTKG